MKVLNWITRRFLNVQSCIAVLPDYEDEEEDHNYLNLKKDGILAIGTLAIGPLVNHNTNDLHDHNLNYNGYDYLEEHPLMNNVALFSHDFEKGGENTEIIEEQITKDVSDELEENDIAQDECQDVKKRVTLADLWLIDSNHKLVKQLGDLKLHQDDVGNDVITSANPCVKIIRPPTSRTKNRLSKAKELLNKEDLHPIKKLNQLMKRMMKKKIHPYLEGKIQHDIGNPSNDEFGPN